MRTIRIRLADRVACFSLLFRAAQGNGTNDRASFYSTHDALESPHSSRSLVTPPLPSVL
jgi:hypothetical protein